MGARTESALERLIAFSDGIFAVAITLLVLSIAVPDLGGKPTDANLQAALYGAGPSILSFVVSFVVVGVFWLSHHRLFQLVREYDRPTLYANLLFLMTICFVPFPTAILTRYGALSTAVIFYALSMGISGSVLAGLWWLAAVRPAHRKPQRKMGSYFALRATRMALIFLLSALVAVYNVDAARYVWFAIFPLYMLLGRIFGRDVRAELRPGI